MTSDLDTTKSNNKRPSTRPTKLGYTSDSGNNDSDSDCSSKRSKPLETEVYPIPKLVESIIATNTGKNFFIFISRQILCILRVNLISLYVYKTVVCNSVLGLSNTSNNSQHLENENISVTWKHLYENEDVPGQNEGSSHQVFVYDQNPADLASQIAAIEKNNEGTVLDIFVCMLDFSSFKSYKLFSICLQSFLQTKDKSFIVYQI